MGVCPYFKRADLGQHGVNPLTDELGTEVVVADRGSCNLRAARAYLHAREAIGGSGVAWGEQQRALCHIEVKVESVLGVGCHLGEHTVQASQGGIGTRRLTGQLHGQVAIVGERPHNDVCMVRGAAFQHRLQGQVEAKRPERAAHAHAFCAQNHLLHAVDGEEACTVDGVEEVHKAGKLWAQPLHRVQHGLAGDGVEAVAEVGLEDGVALLPQRP